MIFKLPDRIVQLPPALTVYRMDLRRVLTAMTYLATVAHLVILYQPAETATKMELKQVLTATMILVQSALHVPPALTVYRMGLNFSLTV